MERKTIGRFGILTFILAAAFPAAADTQFRIRRMTRDDVPLGKGQCDIRLQVDNEVEVVVRRDGVSIHTISGRDAYDDGSECNAPLPDRDLVGFSFEVKDSRNDIRLMEPPSRRNDFAAIVRIRDTSGGQGRYHFRLSWQQPGFEDRRPPTIIEDRRPPIADDRRPGGGFRWNDVVSYQGRGTGMARQNNFRDERLSDCQVNIDRSGRVTVMFRAFRGRDLVFNGNLIDREAGRLRADVVSDDRRFRGVMFISVDGRQQLNSITFDDGEGRDRMRLTWDRR